MKKNYLYPLVLVVITLLSGQTAWAQRLAVTASIANVRSGPGTEKFEILWKIEKYHPLKVIKKDGEWYQFVDFEGDQGWIHQDLVGTVASVITAKKKCNVRSGPGTRFPVVFNVSDGIPFKILKRKNKWIQVQHADGDKGWIYETLVW